MRRLGVILVEDEVLILEELKVSIPWKEYGFEVLGTAGNGIDGERIIEELDPDIVITDIRLPGKTGLEMLEAASVEHGIILSGYTDFNYMQKAIRLGVFDYLQKPVDSTELMDSLKKLRDMILEEEKTEKAIIKGTDGIALPEKIKNHTIRMAIDFIYENYSESIGLQDIAAVTHVTENYIGVYPLSQEAYRLFSKEGKYIGKVGDCGQGPGEYTNVYQGWISEKFGLIYLVPNNANKIMAYDLKGNYLEKRSIPLPYLVPKMNFAIDEAKKEVMVFCLSFSDEPRPNFWRQDFQGHVLDSIRSSRFSVYPDYSNEIHLSHDEENIYAVHYSQFWKQRQDSLFYYDKNSNSLIPKFSVYDPNLGKEKRLFVYKST